MNDIREKQMRLIDDIIRLSMELQDKLGRFDATIGGIGPFYRWDNVVANISRIAIMTRETLEGKKQED